MDGRAISSDFSGEAGGREGEMRALDLLAVVSHFSFFSFVVYCAHPGLKRREADGRRRSLRETAVNLTKTHRPFRSYPSFPAQLTLAAHSLPLSANKQHKVYIFSPLLTFYSRPVAHTLDGIRIRRVPPSCTFPNAIFFCWWKKENVALPSAVFKQAPPSCWWQEFESVFVGMTSWWTPILPSLIAIHVCVALLGKRRRRRKYGGETCIFHRDI